MIFYVSLIVMSVISKGNTPTDRRIHANVTVLYVCVMNIDSF